jgi:hypothetical protein
MISTVNPHARRRDYIRAVAAIHHKCAFARTGQPHMAKGVAMFPLYRSQRETKIANCKTKISNLQLAILNLQSRRSQGNLLSIHCFRLACRHCHGEDADVEFV